MFSYIRIKFQWFYFILRLLFYIILVVIKLYKQREKIQPDGEVGTIYYNSERTISINANVNKC